MISGSYEGVVQDFLSTHERHKRDFGIIEKEQVEGKCVLVVEYRVAPVTMQREVYVLDGSGGYRVIAAETFCAKTAQTKLHIKEIDDSAVVIQDQNSTRRIVL